MCVRNESVLVEEEAASNVRFTPGVRFVVVGVIIEVGLKIFDECTVSLLIVGGKKRDELTELLVLGVIVLVVAVALLCNLTAY